MGTAMWHDIPASMRTASRVGADVPAYLAGVQQVLQSANFGSLSVDIQQDLLFGPTLCSETLGRFCSLNLLSVCKHGTVEVRRFHSTVSALTISCWTAFCVGFVDCFSSHTDWAKQILHAPLADGLAQLRKEQELASLQHLQALMSKHVSRR